MSRNHPPRAYRGGKRHRIDLSVKPHAEAPCPRPGEPGGPGRFIDLAHPQPEGYIKETEAIKAHRDEWLGKRHTFKAAHWTHPNGHPRCKLCLQEEPIGDVCTPPVDLAFDPTEPRDPLTGRWTNREISALERWVTHSHVPDDLKPDFQSALDKMQAGPNVVFRGIDSASPGAKRFVKLHKGDVVHWPGHRSATDKRRIAEGFGSDVYIVKGEKGHTLEYLTPKMRGFSAEREVVLEPGDYKVTGVGASQLHGGASVTLTRIGDLTQDTGVTPKGSTGPRPLHAVGKHVDLSMRHDVSHELRDPTNGKWVRTVGQSAAVDLQMMAQAFADSKFLDALKSVGESHPRKFFDDPDQAFSLPAGDPARAWAAYQCQDYGAINTYLRTGKDVDIDLFPDTMASDLAKDMDKAFKTMGVNTTAPDTKMFRVQGPAGGLDPAMLNVGDIVAEKGITSTGSNLDDIGTFLDDQIDHDPVENGFLMEIHIPKGTRVLGGGGGGIETMLPPGTKFKVMKVDQTTTITGYQKHKLPKVTLEVVK